MSEKIKKIISWIPQFFNDIRMLFLDIKNKKLFKKDMISEREDPKSAFNSYNMVINPDYTIISSIVSIPEAFQIGAINDIERMNKLKELTNPMMTYLSVNLGWSEYLLMPEYYHIEDPSDEHESLTYLVMWKFQPYVLGNYSLLFKDFFLCLSAILLILIAIMFVGVFIASFFVNFHELINYFLQ